MIPIISLFSVMFCQNISDGRIYFQEACTDTGIDMIVEMRAARNIDTDIEVINKGGTIVVRNAFGPSTFILNVLYLSGKHVHKKNTSRTPILYSKTWVYNGTCILFFLFSIQSIGCG